jgi:hypothetical protein
MDDWILAMTSWGIPVDTIAKISGKPAPGNLYYEIATRQEKVMKKLYLLIKRPLKTILMTMCSMQIALLAILNWQMMSMSQGKR